MKIQRQLLYWLLCLFPVLGHAGHFEFKLKAKDLTFEQQNNIYLWLSYIEEKLPSLMKERIDKTITIEFADLKQDSNLYNLCIQREYFHAFKGAPVKNIPSFYTKNMAGNYTVTIDQQFIQAISEGPMTKQIYLCGHSNTYALSMATVIHQLAMIYDDLNFKGPEQKKRYEDCQRKALNIGLRNLDKKCLFQLENSKTLSTHPQMLNILGSEYILDPMVRRRMGEVASARSPDYAEFLNPQEGLAVNIEYFLLDAEYACRRPSLYKKFKDHFNFSPFENKSCEQNEVVIFQRGSVEADSLKFSMQNLYQIQYVRIKPNSNNIANYSGHSMFRYVFCAPERKSPGPECLQDTEFHLVGGFRADPAPWLSRDYLPIAASLGEYASTFYLGSFAEILDEYVAYNRGVVELYPLNLSPDEFKKFFERSLELFWEYRPKYLSFGNNCASSGLSLFQEVIDNEELWQKSLFYPEELYSTLVKFKLIDSDIEKQSIQKRVQNDLYFSTKENIDIVYKIVDSTIEFLHQRNPLGKTDGRYNRMPMNGYGIPLKKDWWPVILD